MAALALMSSGLAAQQQQQQNGSDQQNEAAPTSASLTVGALAIAADAVLAIESMRIDVAVDRLDYTYGVKNTGKNKLALAASVTLPDLELDDKEPVVYDLPTTNAENVVDLHVEANGQAIKTTPHVEALALDVDRAAELKAANIPLIPFSDETRKALNAAKPDVLSGLAALGLIVPHMGDAAVDADWRLHVVHSWTQDLAPGAATTIHIAFAPVKAVYSIDAGSLSGLDSLQDQVCVTPAFRGALSALLKDKGATASVADITMSVVGPARFLQNPPASVRVRKPSSKALVIFCGMDPASQSKDIVTGAIPDNTDVETLRVLIFEKDQ